MSDVSSKCHPLCSGDDDEKQWPASTTERLAHCAHDMISASEKSSRMMSMSISETTGVKEHAAYAAVLFLLSPLPQVKHTLFCVSRDDAQRILVEYDSKSASNNMSNKYNSNNSNMSGNDRLDSDSHDEFQAEEIF